jgi:hypothetical protein
MGGYIPGGTTGMKMLFKVRAAVVVVAAHL